MEDKFKLVTATLVALPVFKHADINDDMLYKKWSRLTKQIETKYALDGEGANLSGLSDEPPDMDKLVLLMLKEKSELKDNAAEVKGKERERNEKMLCHENTILGMHPTPSKFEVSTSSPCTSSIKSSSTSSSIFDVEDFKDKLLDSIREDFCLIEIEDLQSATLYRKVFFSRCTMHAESMDCCEEHVSHPLMAHHMVDKLHS
jgi:hypothetical protein